MGFYIQEDWIAEPPAGQAVLDPSKAKGLTGRWLVNETGGKDHDLSAYRNHALSTAPSVVDVQRGRVRYFDGVSASSIQAGGNSSLLTPAWSIGCWVRLDPTNTGKQPLFTFSSAGERPIFFCNLGDKPILTMASNSYRYWDRESTTLLRDGNWHRVLVCCPGDSISDILDAELYIDGKVQTKSSSGSGDAQTAKTSLSFGIRTASSSTRLAGHLDDICSYSRALSPSEALQDYRNSYHNILGQQVWIPPAAAITGISGTAITLLPEIAANVAGTINNISGIGAGTSLPFSCDVVGKIDGVFGGAEAAVASPSAALIGTVDIVTGSVSCGLPAIVSSAVGGVASTIEGTAQVLLAAFTSSASGAVNKVEGAADATTDTLAGSAIGSIGLNGIGDGYMPAPFAASPGVIGAISGAGAGEILRLIVSAEGDINIVSGGGLATLRTFQVASSGIVNRIAGDAVAITLGLNAVAVGSISSADIIGVASAELPAVSSAISGTVDLISGSGVAYLGSFIGEAIGIHITGSVSGIGEAAMQPFNALATSKYLIDKQLDLILSTDYASTVVYCAGNEYFTIDP